MKLYHRLAIALFVSWLLVIAWIGTIWFLSSRSGEELSGYMIAIPNWDKICHFIAFSAGGAAFAFAIRLTWKLSFGRAIVISILAVALYGAIDEWHQTYTPGRSGADLYDWIFDLLGAVVGSFFMLTLYARRSLTP